MFIDHRSEKPSEPRPPLFRFRSKHITPDRSKNNRIHFFHLHYGITGFGLRLGRILSRTRESELSAAD